MLQEPSASTSTSLGQTQVKLLESSLGTQKWEQFAVVQAMFKFFKEVGLASEMARWKMSAAEEMLDKEIQETSLAPLMVTQKSTALSFSTQ